MTASACAIENGISPCANASSGASVAVGLAVVSNVVTVGAGNVHTFTGLLTPPFVNAKFASDVRSVTGRPVIIACKAAASKLAAAVP